MKRFLVLLLALILVIPPMTASAGFNKHLPTALMTMEFQCGCKSKGCGVMIGRYGLLTAGHNLYCRYHGQGLKSCTFLFGATSAYVGKRKYYNGFTYVVYDTFKKGYKPDHDIGYVIFKYDVGKNTGWYNPRVATDKELNNKGAHIAYYNNSYRFGDDFMTKLTVKNSALLELSEYPSGECAGPVFLWDNDAAYVVGVVSAKSDGTVYARRLTQQVYDDMRNDGAFD